MEDDFASYRVKVSVRNNLLLTEIEKCGFRSVAAFCRANELSVTSVNGLICMRDAPINSNGEFIQAAKDLMEVLGAAPSDLWAEEQLTMKLRRNSGEFRMRSPEFVLTFNRMTLGIEHKESEDVIYENEIKTQILEILNELTPREKKVVIMRYGLDGSPELTLEEVGKAMSVTRERIRQVEAKALRKLRHPQRELSKLIGIEPKKIISEDFDQENLIEEEKDE